MRRLYLIFLAALVLFCSRGGDEEEPSIDDALKISAYLMDESAVGTGYWEYQEGTIHSGRWVADDGRQLEHDDLFKFEPLEVGVPRVMAPMGYPNAWNLNLFFEFDGIVEVDTEITCDEENLWLAYSPDHPDAPWLGGMFYANPVRATAPCTVNVLPIGKFTNSEGLILSSALCDREYFLNVRALSEDGRQVIAAKIRLTVLPDEHFPYEAENIQRFRFFSENEVRSRFVEIELVSYEYSDQYKLDEYYAK